MAIIKYCHTVNILHSNVHKLINHIDGSKLWNHQLTSLKNTHQILSIRNFLTHSRQQENVSITEKLINLFPKTRNPTHTFCTKSRSSNKVITKQWKREKRAINQLLQRSALLQGPRHNHVRCLHTSPSSGKQSDSSKDDDKKKKKNEQDDETISSLLAKGLFCLLSAYMLMTLLLILLPSNNQQEAIRFITWNEFVHHMLAKGEVEEIIVHPDLELITVILHEGAIIKGKRTDQRMYYINIGDTGSFEEKLRAAEQRLGIKPGSGVPVVYKRGTDAIARILAFAILAGILFASMMRGKNFKSPMSMDSFSQMTRAKFTLINPLIGQGKGVHFSDVAGLQEAKQEVMEFVDYLKKPDHYKTLGAKVPKGALLLGPPGCGKTLLAKAVATESNVPFLSMNGSEFIEMIGGLGAARVRDLFKEGRKRAPCIIYIDEIDAIGRKRSSGAGELDSAMGEGEQTLNQLLVEMDGMASIEGIIMLASTNRADVLDKALLRPGRFDRHILIDLPVLAERKEIFEQHLKGIALENAPDTYSKRMAHLTPGFSGADIANVCNEAALHAARHKQRAVTGADLEYAVERVVGGTVKKSHAMSPSEKRVVAYHESGHALVGWLLEYADALLKVTIVPRTNLALGFAQYTPRDQKLYTKEELIDKMCMALGGRAAEALIFNRITTGAQNDLQKVTKMAKAMVREFGMNSEVGLVSFGEDRNSKRPYSKRFAATMEIEEQKIVSTAYQRTCDILSANKDKLEALAQALLQKETLNYADVEKIIGPPPHDNKRFIENIDFDVPSSPTAEPAASGSETQQNSQDQADSQKH